jgi:hypothetical protein
MCQSAAAGIYFTTLSVVQTLIDELERIWTEKVVA